MVVGLICLIMFQKELVSIELTDDGTKTRKKEEKIFTIDDLNNILVDGNKVKQEKN